MTAGMHYKMDFVDMVDMVEMLDSVVFHNNTFVAVDNIDRSRKRRKVLKTM